MSEKLKSGQEILDEFFSNIENLEGVDKDIAELIKKSFQDNKLTAKNISNQLLKMREGEWSWLR